MASEPQSNFCECICPILNYYHHVAYDHDWRRQFIECHINGESDRCSSASRTPSVESLIPDTHSDNTSPNSTPEVTVNKMHPATKQAPPTRNGADNSDMYVTDHIFIHINVKDRIHNIIRWCGYVAAEGTAELTKIYQCTISRETRCGENVNILQVVNVSST